MDVVELVETLNGIITMQSEIIDSLFCTLCQHISVEEAEEITSSDKFTAISDEYRKVQSKFGELRN